MFLMHKASGVLIEIMDPSDLIDPFCPTVVGREHAGEEMQDPDDYPKAEMMFPSGEALPRCWLDPHYREVPQLSSEQSSQEQLLSM
jgi:hypothetical protein